MGENVYANGMQVASKASDTKVVASFPDVCMTPPPPPAGPIPVPYPDTSSSKDLQNGSKQVLIDGKPLALKGSYYQTSPLGNEAATRNFGGSVLTHTITGKTYFQAHSMDVVVEGKNVCRHLDVTTSNHGSYPAGTPPFPNLGKAQKLALDRVARKECPCCGKSKKGCVAAFEEGQEPLSMEEAMGIDPRAPGYKSKRAEEFALLRSVKETECTCKGRVFPSPPCDVYRKPIPGLKTKIEGQWEADKQEGRYKKWYMKKFGVQLHDWAYFMNILKQGYSPNDLEKMDKAMKRPKADRVGDPWADKFKEMNLTAERRARINHLTPKEYGGCPDSPGLAASTNALRRMQRY